jgi:hypothetical protein
MGIRRRVGRYLTRLLVLGAISAAAKYFKGMKEGGARRNNILKLVGRD